VPFRSKICVAEKAAVPSPGMSVVVATGWPLLAGGFCIVCRSAA